MEERMKESDGQRDTKQRRMVYEAVMKRHDHPDVDQIYLDVHAMDKKISKATVYRNLRILSENGLILHVKMPGADRYDNTITQHYHIVCDICGMVIDAPVAYQSVHDEIVESQTGFRIRCHRTVFEGICPECRRIMDARNDNKRSDENDDARESKKDE